MNELFCYFVAASFLPDCFVVVRAFTGDLLFTFFARSRTIWLRRRPVLRALVRFFGLPKGCSSFLLLQLLVTLYPHLLRSTRGKRYQLKQYALYNNTH